MDESGFATTFCFCFAVIITRLRVIITFILRMKLGGQSNGQLCSRNTKPGCLAAVSYRKTTLLCLNTPVELVSGHYHTALSYAQYHMCKRKIARGSTKGCGYRTLPFQTWRVFHKRSGLFIRLQSPTFPKADIALAVRLLYLSAFRSNFNSSFWPCT